MNCLFVYNPVSGKGKTAKREGEIVRVLGEKFGQVDVYATQGPGEMTRVVRERAGGYSRAATVPSMKCCRGCANRVRTRSSGISRAER